MQENTDYQMAKRRHKRLLTLFMAVTLLGAILGAYGFYKSISSYSSNYKITYPELVIDNNE